jgi:hypothetical protein
MNGSVKLRIQGRPHGVLCRDVKVAEVQERECVAATRWRDRGSWGARPSSILVLSPLWIFCFQCCAQTGRCIVFIVNGLDQCSLLDGYKRAADLYMTMTSTIYIDKDVDKTLS